MKIGRILAVPKDDDTHESILKGGFKSWTITANSKETYSGYYVSMINLDRRKVVLSGGHIGGFDVNLFEFYNIVDHVVILPLCF